MSIGWAQLLRAWGYTDLEGAISQSTKCHRVSVTAWQDSDNFTKVRAQLITATVTEINSVLFKCAWVLIQSVQANKHIGTLSDAWNHRSNKSTEIWVNQVLSIKENCDNRCLSCSAFSLALYNTHIHTHIYLGMYMNSTHHCRPDHSALIITPEDTGKTPTLNTLN